MGGEESPQTYVMSSALQPINNAGPLTVYNQPSNEINFLLLERSLHRQCGRLMQERRLNEVRLAKRLQDEKMETS